jgi:hypothetical protein
VTTHPDDNNGPANQQAHGEALIARRGAAYAALDASIVVMFAEQPRHALADQRPVGGH